MECPPPGQDYHGKEVASSVEDWARFNFDVVYTGFHFATEGVLSGLLCVCGLVANILVCPILLHKGNVAGATLLAWLSCADWFNLLGLLLGKVVPSLCFYFKWCTCYVELVRAQKYLWPFGAAAHMMSVWLTVLISVDRYRAICQPLQVQKMKLRRVLPPLLLVCVLFNVPRFFHHHVVTTEVVPKDLGRPPPGNDTKCDVNEDAHYDYPLIAPNLTDSQDVELPSITPYNQAFTSREIKAWLNDSLERSSSSTANLMNDISTQPYGRGDIRSNPNRSKRETSNSRTPEGLTMDWSPGVTSRENLIVQPAVTSHSAVNEQDLSTATSLIVTDTDNRHPMRDIFTSNGKLIETTPDVRTRRPRLRPRGSFNGHVTARHQEEDVPEAEQCYLDDKMAGIVAKNSATLGYVGTNPLYRIIYFVGLSWLLMYILPLALLVGLNIRLFVAIREARKRHAALTRTEEGKNNISVTINVVAVVTVFIVCKTPDFVDNVISYPVLDLNKTFLSYFSCVCSVLQAINYSCNFLIYCLFFRKFRQIARHLYCGKEVVRQQSISNSTSSNKV